MRTDLPIAADLFKKISDNQKRLIGLIAERAIGFIADKLNFINDQLDKNPSWKSESHECVINGNMIEFSMSIKVDDIIPSYSMTIEKVKAIGADVLNQVVAQMAQYGYKISTACILEVLTDRDGDITSLHVRPVKIHIIPGSMDDSSPIKYDRSHLR